MPKVTRLIGVSWTPGRWPLPSHRKAEDQSGEALWRWQKVREPSGSRRRLKGDGVAMEGNGSSLSTGIEREGTGAVCEREPRQEAEATVGSYNVGIVTHAGRERAKETPSEGPGRWGPTSVVHTAICPLPPEDSLG